MKSRTTLSVAAFTFMGLLVATLYSCSKDKDEVLPDDNKPGKVYDIDGNKYKTVKIGSHIWMAENLRVTKYNNSDPIPTGLGDAEWKNTAQGAYAIYPHEDIPGLHSDAEVVEAFGKLYNWYAVDDARGICPEGWFVPSDDDWTALVNYVVAQGFPDEGGNPNGAGNALKSCRQVGSPVDSCNTTAFPRWSADGTHKGFDEFGFGALPGGIRGSFEEHEFDQVGSHGLWWTSGGSSSATARFWCMFKNNGKVFQYDNWKWHGYNVRCIRHIE